MTKQSGTLIGQAGLAGLLALMLGQSAQGVAFSAFTPALPQMAQSFNASGHGMVLAQQAVTIAAFGLIAGSFASGKIIDMFGARMTILVSMLLFAVCGSGGLFLQNVWILLATRVVVGFAIACTTTACINTISTVFQGNLRSQAIGMSSGFGSALGLISLLLGGFLAQNFGWREAFIQFPVFGFLALILALFGVKNTHAEVAHETDLNTHAGLRLWPYYVLCIIIAAVVFMGSSQLAFLLPTDGVTKATSISDVMAMITVMATIVSFFFGNIERRLGLTGTLVTAFAIITFGLLLLGLVAIPVAAVVGAMALGTYLAIAMPFLYHIVSIKAPQEGRAKAIGMVGAFVYVGAFLNPFFFTPMAELLGLHGTFVATGIFMGLLGLGLLFMGRGIGLTQPMPAVTKQ
jgi:MFS family permease